MFKRILETTAILSMIAASCFVIWAVAGQSRGGGGTTGPDTNTEEDAPPSSPISLALAPEKGNKDAKVGMVVFSDFECPYCSAFARDTLPAVESEYVKTGKIRLAFRHMPGRAHKSARSAATAAVCAGRQGKFWEMHDLLFKDSDLSEAAFVTYSKSLALDTQRFGECRATEAPAVVQADAALAKTLGLSGTPAFVFGAVDDHDSVVPKILVTGAQPLSSFERVLNRLLATDAAAKR